MILLLAAALCEVLADPGSRRERALAQDVQLEITTDRRMYVIGEPVEFKFVGRNKTDTPVRDHLAVHPLSSYTHVYVRRDGGQYRPLRLYPGRHESLMIVRSLGPKESFSEKGTFAIDYGRDAYILDEAGTYEFKATYCDREGDANAILESDVWTVEVEPAPDRHRDAFGAYSKELAQFSAWPVPEEPTGQLVDQAFDFVERFPDSPWATPLRRMLVAKMPNRLVRKEATPLQQERFQRLLQEESLRETGRVPGPPPSP